MAIRFECPGCATDYTAHDYSAGKSIVCQACGQTLQIPGQTCEPIPKIAQDNAARRRQNNREREVGAIRPSAKGTRASGACNLFDMVSSDLDHLTEQIAECLSKPQAVQAARQLCQGSPAAPAFETLDFSDRRYVKRTGWLAVGSDCLNRINEAILADLVVEPEELSVAYELVGPLADYFAKFIDKYSGFAGLRSSETAEFLHEFLTDQSLFGGHEDRPVGYFGACLCMIVSVLEGSTAPFKTYEAVIEQLMAAVIDGGNRDRISRIERRAIIRAEQFHKVVRDDIAACLQNPGSAQPSSGNSFGTVAELSGKASVTASHTTPENALRQANTELEALVGLPEVKAEVKGLMSYLTIQMERQKHGLPHSSQSLHFVFTGNPGTGKTTVARILGNVFFGFGLLTTPKMVECDRAKVVGGFLGQTAIKMDEVIQSALDGVLFIDEAYTLAGDQAKYGHGDMYGDEAISTLLKRMEDYRSRLIVVAAGYPAPMQKFLHANPGLQSRFTRFISFGDYSVADLCRIFDSHCRSPQYRLSQAACVQAYILFADAHRRRDERFGNARFVRNVYEQVIARQSVRLTAAGKQMDKSSLMTVDCLDFPAIPIEMPPPTPDGSVQTRWGAVCPYCERESVGSFKCLGQQVVCKCGKVFWFPWWCPQAAPVKGMSSDLLTSVSQADKRGTRVITPPSIPVQSKTALRGIVWVNFTVLGGYRSGF